MTDGRGAGRAPRLARAAARRRSSSARPTRWAIERARHRRARADGARRARASPSSCAAARPDGPDRRSSAARATTAATASSRRGCCARPGREVDVLLLGAGEELARRRAGQPRAPAGRRRRGRSSPARCDGAAAIVDAMLGTGFSGEPREPARGGDRRDQRGRRRGAVVFACDVPERRRRLHRRGRRRRRCAPTPPPPSTPPSRGCGSRPARRTPARSRSIDIGIPRRRAGRRPSVGLIAGRGARRRCPRRGARVDQVRRRQRARLRRLHRAHRARRAMAVGGGDARRRRLRHRARARLAEPRLRAAAARGHVGAAPRRGRAR